MRYKDMPVNELTEKLKEIRESIVLCEKDIRIFEKEAVLRKRRVQQLMNEENLIQDALLKIREKAELPPPEPVGIQKGTFNSKNLNFHGTRPLYFTFKGEKYLTKTYSDLFRQFMYVLYNENPGSVTDMAMEGFKEQNSRKPLISHVKRSVRGAEEIPGTGIYITGGMGTEKIMWFMRNAAERAGINPEDIGITIAER